MRTNLEQVKDTSRGRRRDLFVVCMQLPWHGGERAEEEEEEEEEASYYFYSKLAWKRSQLPRSVCPAIHALRKYLQLMILR